MPKQFDRTVDIINYNIFIFQCKNRVIFKLVELVNISIQITVAVFIKKK